MPCATSRAFTLAGLRTAQDLGIPLGPPPGHLKRTAVQLARHIWRCVQVYGTPAPAKLRQPSSFEPFIAHIYTLKVRLGVDFFFFEVFVLLLWHGARQARAPFFCWYF